jgi:hypothetical protein
MTSSEDYLRAQREQDAQIREQYRKAGLRDLTDFEVESMDRIGKFVIFCTCLAGIAMAGFVIVYNYPMAPIGYGVALGAGLGAAWLTWKILNIGLVLELFELVLMLPKWFIVILTIGSVAAWMMWG